MEPAAADIVREFIEAAQLPAVGRADDGVLATLLANFDSDLSNAARDIQRLIERYPGRFLSSAFRALRTNPQGAGPEFLRDLLWRNNALLDGLADPALFDLKRAIELAKAWSRLEPALDVKLLRSVFAAELEAEIDVNRARRILEIVSTLAPHPRVLPLVIKLLRHPDPRLQSKATALFCRNSKNVQWAREKLGAPDARVRANAIEALWGTDSAAMRALLADAAMDPDHRVVANALVGLYYIAGSDAAARLEQMAKSPKQAFRSAAGFAMGQTLDPVFVPTLNALVKDGDAGVRRQALRDVAQAVRD